MQAPEFRGERCTHARLTWTGCRRCVDACPSGALALGEQALELDTQACDGCGLCAAACPQQAIAAADPLAALARRDGTWFAACGRAGVGRASTLACLRAIDWRALLRMHAQGMRTLEVAACAGNACERDGCADPDGAAFSGRVEQFNLMLSSRGAETVRLVTLAPEVWCVRQARAWSAGAADASRRAFLTRLVKPASGVDVVALPGLPGEDGPQAVYPALPEIDVDACSGCDACTRVCDTGALILDRPGTDRSGTDQSGTDRSGAGSTYRIDPARCSGCEACVDVCATEAVSVQRWRAGVQRSVALREARCSACGVRFHTPAPRATNRCAICATVNHHARLFQRQ